MSPRSPMKEWSGQDTFEDAPQTPKAERPPEEAESEAETGAEGGLSEKESLQIERESFEDMLKDVEGKLELLSSSFEKQYKGKAGGEERYAGQVESNLAEKQKALTELLDIAKAQGDKKAERKFQEDLEDTAEARRRNARKRPRPTEKAA